MEINVCLSHLSGKEEKLYKQWFGFIFQEFGRLVTLSRIEISTYGEKAWTNKFWWKNSSNYFGLEKTPPIYYMEILKTINVYYLKKLYDLLSKSND